MAQSSGNLVQYLDSAPALLRLGSFAPKEKLRHRILAFIAFFNDTLAKPFRWTYTGKPLLI
jgi:hypothetical protein